MKQRITTIILAAGGSTRFGKPKQLHLYDGEPLVQRAVNAALGAGSQEVVIVLGSDAEAIAAALDQDPQIQTVVNHDWNTGLASSLKVGLSAIGEATDGILVMLADQLLVDASALSKLLEQFQAGHRIVASGYADTVGVPAVFGSEYMEELRILSGDHGAGQWIRAKLRDVTIVSLEAAAADVDTPGDAARLEEL